MVSALLAIVLGLLIWTSYGVFTQQQSEAATLGAQLVQFDVLLDRLGPEGALGRESHAPGADRGAQAFLEGRRDQQAPA